MRRKYKTRRPEVPAETEVGATAEPESVVEGVEDVEIEAPEPVEPETAVESDEPVVPETEPETEVDTTEIRFPCGCGGEGVQAKPDNIYRRTYQVSCNKCGVATKKRFDEASSVADWNRAMGGKGSERS